jgi:circadian clock protein KaiC
VLDPISAVDRLNSGTGGIGVSGVVERLTRWSKQAGLTLLCTSLTSSPAPEIESTSLQISTIADTWIHLSYRVHAGERNRALTVIKSRGTSHSNQVRELLLSDGGITLTDVFTAGGEVLMGTLRWEREEAARVAESLHAAEIERRRVALTREQGDLRARLSALEQEITTKHAELQEVEAEAVSSAAADQRRRKDTARRRHADAVNGVRRGRRA